MKKLLRNKFVIAFAIISLFVGSIQVYATTGLDPYALTLIKVILDIKQNEIDDTINARTREFVEGNRNQLEDYIGTATDKVINNVKNFTNEEVARADQELNAYTNDLIRQLDGVMLIEEERLRGVVTRRVNEYMDMLKQELLRELNFELEKHMLEQIK